MSEAQEQPNTEAPAIAETTNVEAQETVATEAPVVETKPQEEAPAIPKKFLKEDGSPDLVKLAKSYTELEKKLSSPEEAAKRKKLGDILPSMAQPILPQIDETSATDDFYSNPMGTIQAEIRKAVAPYEAKIKYNEMAQAVEKAKSSLPKFSEWESDITDTILNTPALTALAKIGEPSVFNLAYSQVLSKKQSELVSEAYEKGKNERQVINNSKPKVEGTSATPPTPVRLSSSEAIAKLREQGMSISDILVHDDVLTPAERKLFERK